MWQHARTFLSLAAFGVATACQVAVADNVMTSPGAHEGAIECHAAPQASERAMQVLCDALRAEAPLQALQLHLLSAGPAALSARLDRLQDGRVRVGPVLDFNVMGRDLTPQDYQRFARDLLRFRDPT
ncbi:hypothetical protein [Paracoccus sp. (in: a-proteobacteria)]|uniref:hypothetical protein n=1 Tax=Paracoccus sp. TaxID=267 RepID=UPI00396CD211